MVFPSQSSVLCQSRCFNHNQFLYMEQCGYYQVVTQNTDISSHNICDGTVGWMSSSSFWEFKDSMCLLVLTDVHDHMVLSSIQGQKFKLGSTHKVWSTSKSHNRWEGLIKSQHFLPMNNFLIKVSNDQCAHATRLVSIS